LEVEENDLGRRKKLKKKKEKTTERKTKRKTRRALYLGSEMMTVHSVKACNRD
jgi:hypothetical protein